MTSAIRSPWANNADPWLPEQAYRQVRSMAGLYRMQAYPVQNHSHPFGKNRWE